MEWHKVISIIAANIGCLTCIFYLISWIFNKNHSDLKKICLVLERIHDKIDNHVKITEEAHNHTMAEKRKSGR